MLIKELKKYAYQRLGREEFRDLEERLAMQGIEMEYDHLRLTDLVALDENVLGKALVLKVWQKTEEDGRIWRQLKGYLHVYVCSWGEIEIEKYYPNSPYTVFDSDVNRVEVYKTDEGYFVPRTWKLYKDFQERYRVEYDLKKGVDGATRVDIVGEEI